MESEVSTIANEFLDRIPYTPLLGHEPLVGITDKSVIDYWRWAYSDIVENIQRGTYAEFLVACALGIESQRRFGWNGYDLNYGGYKVEVKSSAFLQDWPQRKHSQIVFSIGPRRQLADDGISLESEARFAADCYVFCVFGDKHGPTADILDMSRWWFYVAPTAALRKLCGETARSVSEKRLHSLVEQITYAEVRSAVDNCRDSALPDRPAG